MRVGVLALVAAALMGCATASTDVLTDAQLVSRASSVFASKETPADRILGVHRGAQVIVETRCGDVCPAYTIRIIHYMMPAGPACTSLGGDIVGIAVPMGIAVVSQDFCIPHALYQRKLYTDHPYQK